MKQPFRLCVSYVLCVVLSACGGGGTSSVPGSSQGASASVSVTPGSISFNGLGASYAQYVSVYQSSSTGGYTQTNNCTNVATIGLSNISGGTASYLVTPAGAGGCTVTFSGRGDQSGVLSISVTPYGGIGVDPSSFSFYATGASYAQVLDVSQSGYVGAFTESDTCSNSGIANVQQTSDANGAATYTVTPSAAGTCQITIGGGNSDTANVGVTVTTSGFGVDVGDGARHP